LHKPEKQALLGAGKEISIYCDCRFVFFGVYVAVSLMEEKGVDASAVQPGASRAQAEAILGNAVKEWRSASGVRCGIYHYEAGRRADWDRAYGRAIINLATLGFADLFELIPNHPQFKFYEANRKRRTVVPIVVSFDVKEMILGIFDEFDELPPDGRSVPRNWQKY
jgi:hypothetical protein